MVEMRKLFELSAREQKVVMQGRREAGMCEAGFDAEERGEWSKHVGEAAIEH